MIVESITKRQIGEVFILPEFECGVSRCVPASIMREATEQEYIDDCLSDPSLPASSKVLMVITNNPKLFWYEVLVD